MDRDAERFHQMFDNLYPDESEENFFKELEDEAKIERLREEADDE